MTDVHLKGSVVEPAILAQTEAAGMHLAFVFVIMVTLISTAIAILVWCKLFAKAGYSWALGLLVLVPIANIVLPIYLAFADWPIHKKLRQLRQPRSGLPT